MPDYVTESIREEVSEAGLAPLHERVRNLETFCESEQRELVFLFRRIDEFESAAAVRRQEFESAAAALRQEFEDLKVCVSTSLSTLQGLINVALERTDEVTAVPNPRRGVARIPKR